MTDEPTDQNEDWLFDFFEEGETRENAPREDTPAAPVGTAPPAHVPRRGPSAHGRARARLLALAVVVVLVVAAGIIVAVGSGSEAGPDSAYLTRVAVPAQDSQAVGVALDKLLSAPSGSPHTFESKLDSLISQQTNDLNQMAAIAAPPRLRAEQQEAVSAMQFRVSGLSGLAIGFRDAVANPKETQWGAQLSLQADGLITSDVIWRDFFVTPVNAQIVRDGVQSGTAPVSTFIANANVTAPTAMDSVLATLEGHASSTTSSTADLQLGDTGTGVTAWQTQLNMWIATQSSLTKLTVSGTFDQPTQAATEALQQAEDIPVDGVVGPQTRAALTTALGQNG